jgi:predicted component of type VI protein secretion system
VCGEIPRKWRKVMNIKTNPSVKKIIAYYKKLGFANTTNSDKDWLKITKDDVGYYITIMATTHHGIPTFLISVDKNLVDGDVRTKVTLNMHDVAPDFNPKAIIKMVDDFNLINNALKGH